MTRGSTARQLAPERVRPQSRRVGLKVVDKKSASRRRLVKWSFRVLGVGLVVALFLAAALHAEIAAQETALQRIRARVAAEQTRYGNLRLEVAQLSAPSRIISEAQRLGLVTPGTVTYLPSTGPTVRPSQQDTPNDWSEVKPNLAPRP